MHVISLRHPKEIKNLMQAIQVDPYGIKIMLPKAISLLVKFSDLSSIAANILKQEMLSLGGDVAIAKGALTGKPKKTDGIIMANLSQLTLLIEKLKTQPFGLNRFSKDLDKLLSNCQKDNYTLDLGRVKFNLKNRTLIMGIINLTPDSFSGDGLFGLPLQKIINIIEEKIRQGADIIDLGGESSRPGAKPVCLKEELKRTIPIIKLLAKKTKVPISIDTYKPEVAKQALDNGACLVNDITGLRDQRMAKIISRYKAGVVIMHMQGRPQTMQKNPHYKSLVSEIIQYLGHSLKICLDTGISKEKIILDPGIGFGKTLEHNLEILNRLSEFKSLGEPLMVGVSRKSFIGKLIGATVEERLLGSIAAAVLAVINGASIVRVHDIKETKEALRVIEAIIKK